MFNVGFRWPRSLHMRSPAASARPVKFVKVAVSSTMHRNTWRKPVPRVLDMLVSLLKPARLHIHVQT